MTNFFKKMLSLVLACMMLVGMLPISAMAANQASTPLETISDTYINPLYAGEITEADLNDPGIMSVDDLYYYEDPAEAGKEVLGGMKLRQETIAVGFYSTQYSEAYIKSVMHEIVDSALEHNGTPDEGDYLLWQYGGWKCSASGYGQSGSYYITLTYTVTYYTTVEQEAEMDDAVSALLEELDPSGTDYQKVKVIYDWLCDNVAYDYDNLNDKSYMLKHTAYAALMNKTAVCQGYAVLLYRLALEMDIDCRVIPGDSDGDGLADHAWNIICLDNRYYNLDATWDTNYADNDNYRYFLVTNENFPRHTRNDDYNDDAFNAAYVMGDADYQEIPDDTCGENLTWNLSEEGVLTISGTGPMYDYEAGAAPWSAYTSEIKAIVIEDAVTTIGTEAFCDCENLEEVIIGNDVTAIGDYAFYYCTGLTDVTIGDSVATIGVGAFYECESLNDVIIPDSVENIDAEAFSYCYALTTVTMGSGVTTIGECAFYECYSLTGITIPAGVTVIGDFAFMYCAELQKIDFQGSAPVIAEDAFFNVTATAYYPDGDDTWTEDTMQDYGGTITWVSVCNHEYTAVVTAPTCTKQGYTTYTCDLCGDSYADNYVEANGHNYTSVVTDPTCTEQGYTTNTCDLCGDSYVDNYVEANGHNYTSVVTDPTCTEQGYTTNTCNLCGDSYVDNYVDANGHSYENGSCTVCGDPDESYAESAIKITAQPVDYVGLVGDTATFTVTAEGEGLTYQWEFSQNGGEIWEKASSTSNSISVEFKAYRVTYQYRCVITDAEGNSVITDVVKLVAKEVDLVILTQPESYVGAVNDDVTFTVEATGNGLTYEWFFSDNGGETWAKSYSPGYQTNTLSPILRSHRDGNMYKCVVTDVLGNSVESNAVSMTVETDEIIIVTQPVSVENAVLGQLYGFSVEAEGVNLTYRWELSTDGGETWQESWNQGYNTANLSVRMNANRDGNMYRCAITSGQKLTVYTEAVVLDLQDPSVKLISQSDSIFVTAGQTATFTVEAEGTDLTYLWYRSDDKGATWYQTYLSGYNTNPLSFEAKTNRAAMFMCKITDGSGTVVWSSPVKLQVLSAELKILTQPADVTCANGEMATFTVEAQGDTLKYQWYASTDNGENWDLTYLSGSTTDTLSFAVNAARAAKIYKCIITDAAGNTVETTPVKVTTQ